MTEREYGSPKGIPQQQRCALTFNDHLDIYTLQQYTHLHLLHIHILRLFWVRKEHSKQNNKKRNQRNHFCMQNHRQYYIHIHHNAAATILANDVCMKKNVFKSDFMMQQEKHKYFIVAKTHY